MFSRQHFFKNKLNVKKDYQKKEFVNPYFRNKKPSGGFNTGRYLKITGAILIIYLLIYSDLFRIEQIEIQGTEMIAIEELDAAAANFLNGRKWLVLPQNNLFLLDKPALARRLHGDFNLKQLTINRSWKKIKVTVQEKISYLIIFNKSNFYFADDAGQIISEISQNKIGEYWHKFPILNVGEKKIKINDQIVSAKEVDFILRLNEALLVTPIRAQGFESGGEQEVNLVAKEGWRAYFDINVNLTASLDNLLLILKEKVKDQTKVEYIDLRFGDKVFYK